METVHVNTAQHVRIDYPVAGLGERIVARLIDLAMFIAGFIALMIGGVTAKTQGSGYLAIGLMIAFYACYVFYNLLCEIFMNGQSVGKRIMKIKVISLDGGQPTLGQYLLRWLFRIVDFVLTAQVGGLICVALSEKKQRIGDIAAGTTVIKTEKRTEIGQIAFLQEDAQDYQPVFSVVTELGDRDIELIHEVIRTYELSKNPGIVLAMAGRVSTKLGLSLPEGMNELQFLRTLVKDYNHLTALT
ncbi:RDD family protein [Pedobacter deserti]|uniref:RDD family protein n=1 Tax=Pedobacter deserti TaxID=2817382 RepID=UPI0021097E0B|nr:RDD family protein [Pedobacter sp. SYSU D00382]